MNSSAVGEPLSLVQPLGCLHQHEGNQVHSPIPLFRHFVVECFVCIFPAAAGSGNSRFQTTLHALRFSASFNQDLTTDRDFLFYPARFRGNCFSSGFISRFFAWLFPRFSTSFRVRLRRRIPTGFRNKARGCEERATLGNRGVNNLNPNGVAARGRARETQPRWGERATLPTATSLRRNRSPACQYCYGGREQSKQRPKNLERGPSPC